MERLVKILDDNLEELYMIDDKITEKMIKSYWKEYMKSNYDSFEEYLKQHSLNRGIKSVFVDEITM